MYGRLCILRRCYYAGWCRRHRGCEDNPLATCIATVRCCSIQSSTGQNESSRSIAYSVIGYSNAESVYSLIITSVIFNSINRISAMPPTLCHSVEGRAAWRKVSMIEQITGIRSIYVSIIASVCIQLENSLIRPSIKSRSSYGKTALWATSICVDTPISKSV